MPGYDARSDSEAAKVASVTAGALETDTARRLILTVGTGITSITLPAGAWKYLKVINNGTPTVDERPTVTVALGQDPTDSSGSAPTFTWGVGYDVGLGQELIPVNIGLGITQVRIKSTSALTAVILNFIL